MSQRLKQLKTESRQRLKFWVESFLSECITCGETDKICLDFHHVDPSTKLFNVAYAKQRGWRRTLILAEILKCVILCANCHRRYNAGVLKLPRNKKGWRRRAMGLRVIQPPRGNKFEDRS